jgi:predicted PurR-regulated permease PerM
MIVENPRYDIFTLIVIFLILLTIFVIYFPLARTIILGMTLAVVAYPLHKRFCQKMNESAAAALATLIAFLLIAGLLWLMVHILIASSGLIYEEITIIVVWLNSFGHNSIMPGLALGGALEEIVTALKDFVIPLIANIPGMVFNAIIFFLSVFLFLLKGPAVSQEIREALPVKLNASIEKISGLSVDTLYAIYIVSVEVAILTFLIALPIFYFLGYPGYLQLAIFAGLSMFVPIIGPFIVMAFIVLLELASGDITGVFIAVFLIYPIALWLPGSYIRAKLMGKRVPIHPFLLLVGIIGGIAVMGISGLIFGPFFIALLISSYKILIDQMKGAKEGRDSPG